MPKFVTFRSHYMFESRYCTPGQAHEKGGVEGDVGFVRRNFLTPPPKVESFEELNARLLAACREDELRTVERQKQSIGEAWQLEQTKLLPLPRDEFACCSHHEVSLNRYGQVVFETNRYSVPAEKVRKTLTLRAYPFHIEIVADHELIAVHPRCYERKVDILNPLHYLPLLEERPGAFEHAKPLRQWRKTWPATYEKLLDALRERHEGESQAVREFVCVLQLHQEHGAEVIEKAIEQALVQGVPHLEGVTFCLHQLCDPTPIVPPLDLSTQPELMPIASHAIALEQYNRLLEGVER